MAALAASAATLVDPLLYGPNEWYTRGLDNRGVITRVLKLVLTGQGGQTNTIGASALGLDRLLDCTNLFDDTNNLVYGAVVDPITNTVVLDAGNAGTPTDVTTTAAYITVTGTVKAPSAT